MDTPAILIAGTHSGSGKTTVSLAVMSALARRGLEVQGFKVGPDFIDTGHQFAITGRASRNLDTWLLDPDALAATYRRATRGAEIAVIEGVMGLFDGRGPIDESGSTADLARQLGLPVVLVVDARGMSRSVAPLVRGFVDFDRDVSIVGVVANKVGSANHHDNYLAPALVESCSQVARLGYLLRNVELAIPSRHLGLLTADEFKASSRFLDQIADAAEATLEIDEMIKLARVPTLPLEPAPLSQEPRKPIARVAWARGPAFCFNYDDNLDHFREAGAEIVPFSPVNSSELPRGTDVLVLGGGYPEVFAGRIAENRAMRESIRTFHADGGVILAECGGMMACCRELVDLEGRSFPMWDLIPARAVMKPRFQALGYVTIETNGPTPLGRSGTTIRGHEFHYSTLDLLAPVDHATTLHRPGRESKPDGVRVGGLLAGYAHLHLGSNPAVARHVLNWSRSGSTVS